MTNINLRIGTCSWVDKSLIRSGTFYPSGCYTPEARIRFYSSIFPTVEVDTSYYAIPPRTTTELWSNRTPKNFKFHVKAFRLFTGHSAQVHVLPVELRDSASHYANKNGEVYIGNLPQRITLRLWELFYESIMPLKRTDKLGVILFQFAPWIYPTSENFKYILQCKEHLYGFQTAIEFRNKYWLSKERLEQTISFLRKHKLIYVCVDEPQGFQSSVPPFIDITGPGAYVRFHGLNHAMWERKTKTSAERFNYWYKKEDFEAWIPRIQHLAQNVDDVNILFNTNNQNQGPWNAHLLSRLLEQSPVKMNVTGLGRILELYN